MANADNTVAEGTSSRPAERHFPFINENFEVGALDKPKLVCPYYNGSEEPFSGKANGLLLFVDDVSKYASTEDVLGRLHQQPGRVMHFFIPTPRIN